MTPIARLVRRDCEAGRGHDYCREARQFIRQKTLLPARARGRERVESTLLIGFGADASSELGYFRNLKTRRPLLWKRRMLWRTVAHYPECV
jgi:hypothetical protein